MSDETDINPQKLGKHGANWVRADFHLHTIKERGASRKEYRKEWAGKESKFPQAFVERLSEKKVKVAAITNHNTFDYDEYRSISKKARKTDILVLPGLELGIHGGNSTIHTLVIFDPKNLSADNNFISRFLAGAFPGGNPNEGAATTGDLFECVNRLESLGESYFIIFAHVESDNGLLKDTTKTALEPIFKRIGKDTWESRILGFQGVKSEPSWIEQKLPTGMPIPAFVEGSDLVSSLSQVGREENGVCYIKLSELSYHSVRFALRDHVLRVRPEIPFRPSVPRVNTIGISGGKRGAALYHLSDNLNSLIGSRGSGKSLMIEALRWCLNIPLGKGDTTYKSDLIHAFLDHGATVKVHGTTAEGKAFEISRSYTAKREQPESQVSVDGEALNISVDAILPGVLYFGQKDLGERDKESTENIFEQLLPTVPDTLTQSVEKVYSEFETTIDTYQIARQAQEKDDELKFEEKTLTQKIDAFKEFGVEERLKEITGFDQDLRRLRELLRTIQGERESLNKAYHPEEEIVSWGDVLQSDLNDDLKPEMVSLKATYEAARMDISTGIGTLKTLEDGITDIDRKLNGKLKERQETFAKILREVNQPELDIDAYRKMVSRLEQIKETRDKTKEKKGKLDTFEKAIIERGNAWHKALEGITRFNLEHITKINERLPDEINIHQDFQGDTDSFLAFLKEIFAGSGFNTTSYDALVSSAKHGLDLFVRREALQRTELTPVMREKFVTKMDERFKKILTFSPLDQRLIEYEGTKISELSLGKQAMAILLLLLSLDTHPIIILDQPEDDLDNETIHGFIVKPLIENKDRIQFIIATHNPNIPVLGDAEQVIACYEEPKGQYRENFGSLDMPVTKDAIIDIMEGGPQAFEKRHDIYTLWAKSH